MTDEGKSRDNSYVGGLEIQQSIFVLKNREFQKGLPEDEFKKNAQLENYLVYLTTWERVLSCFRMFLEKLGKANRHIEN